MLLFSILPPLKQDHLKWLLEENSSLGKCVLSNCNSSKEWETRMPYSTIYSILQPFSYFGKSVFSAMKQSIRCPSTQCGSKCSSTTLESAFSDSENSNTTMHSGYIDYYVNTKKTLICRILLPCQTHSLFLRAFTENLKKFLKVCFQKTIHASELRC